MQKAKKSQTTIRVELIRDEEKYLDPNMGSYLGNTTLKYGDLKYTMHKENSRNGLSLVSRNIDKIVVTIATPLTENLELIHHRKSIMVYIKDAGLGGGSGGVGELEMTLEVYKLTENIELCAILYVNDMYHLRMYNDEFMRKLLTDMKESKSGLTTDVRYLTKSAEGIEILSKIINGDLIKGMDVNYNECDSKILDTLASTAKNICDVIRVYVTNKDSIQRIEIYVVLQLC